MTAETELFLDLDQITTTDKSHRGIITKFLQRRHHFRSRVITSRSERPIHVEHADGFGEDALGERFDSGREDIGWGSGHFVGKAVSKALNRSDSEGK